jgi:hypothetical protein
MIVIRIIHSILNHSDGEKQTSLLAATTAEFRAGGRSYMGISDEKQAGRGFQCVPSAMGTGPPKF